MSSRRPSLPSPLLPLLALSLALAAAGCPGDDDGGDADGDGPSGPATVVFDLDAPLSEPARFWDLPWPSDLRLDAEGRPDTRGYPVKQGTELFAQLRDVAGERPGWPVMPAAYFRFDAALPPTSPDTVYPAEASSKVLLVDVDADSPERGALTPTVAATIAVDDWAPNYLLGVAPRPGFVLVPGRTYAFVILKSFGGADGRPLGAHPALVALAAGDTPPGALGAAAAVLYDPLWETLAAIGVAPADVAAATVFTTGDVVAETAALSSGLVDKHDAQIGALTLDATDGVHPRYCELITTLTVPMFMVGDEPFDDDGHFVFGGDGLPEVQKMIQVPAVITIPRAPMPAAGYPLTLYFHGSGGYSSQVVDRGPVLVVGGNETPGEGPAHVLAAHGFATAGAALPVNPERVPGASEIEYLNFENLDAFPYLFRQGVFEQRLFLEALAELTIPPEALAGCAGPTLPMGASEFHFDADALFGMGQSMGGMYTNMIGAVEPRLRALVPTGAGGYWGFMLLQATGFAEVASLLPVLVGASTDEPFHYLHPATALLHLAWEPAEPFVHMPRLARRPLPGYAPRPVYQPVGYLDHDFAPPVYDAAALAYGHQQVGEEVWDTMQPALALAGLGGVLAYPVAGNLMSGGVSYTGVVVQYEGDGIIDPHNIAFQRDEVRYQYGCFLRTAYETGVAVVPAPAPLGSACPPPPPPR